MSSLLTGGPGLERLCMADKDPYGVRIATPAARELLPFENRALCVMAFGVIDAGHAVHVSGACWRFAHSRRYGTAPHHRKYELYAT